MRCNAAAQVLDDEIIERKLERRLTCFVLRRGGIRLFTHRNQSASIEIGGQIEMRNCLLGLGQPRRDGAAHRVERHLFVGNALIQCLYLRRARAGCHCRRCDARRRAFDVDGDDSFRADLNRNTCQVDATLSG
jgi:hypothetical protein